MGNGILQTAVQTIVLGLVVVIVLAGLTYLGNAVPPATGEVQAAADDEVKLPAQHEKSQGHKSDGGAKLESGSLDQRPIANTEAFDPEHQKFRPLRSINAQSLVTGFVEQRRLSEERERRLNQLEISIRRMERIEERLDRLLFTMAQAQTSPQAPGAEDSRVAQVLRRELSEWRINNEVELRDLARQLTGVSSNQEKLTQDWQKYQQELRDSLARQRKQKIAEEQVRAEQEPQYEYVELRSGPTAAESDDDSSTIHPRVIELREINPARRLQPGHNDAPDSVPVRPSVPDALSGGSASIAPAARSSRESVQTVSAVDSVPARAQRYRITSTLIHVTLNSGDDVRSGGITKVDRAQVDVNKSAGIPAVAHRKRHRQEVERLLDSLPSAAAVERLGTRSRSVDVDSFVEFPIGSLCLHCNEKHGLESGDMLVVKPIEAGKGTMLAIEGSRSTKSEEAGPVGSFHRAVVDIADGDTLIISEIGQDGIMKTDAGESDDGFPADQRRIVQRLTVLTIESTASTQVAPVRSADFQSRPAETNFEPTRPSGLRPRIPEAVDSLPNAELPVENDLSPAIEAARERTREYESLIESVRDTTVPRGSDQATAVRGLPGLESELVRPRAEPAR